MMGQGHSTHTGYTRWRVHLPVSIPLALKSALESGDCVLFVGAGIGGHLRTAAGDLVPNARELAMALSNEHGISGDGTDVLTKVARVIELRKGRPALEASIRRKIADLTPDAHFQWLSTIRWKAIFTTNYDFGLERSYELNGKPLQQPVSISVATDLQTCDPRLEVPIYHIHGALAGQHSEIVITDEDYAKFSHRRHMLFEMLKLNFGTSTILYVGYGNKDPNWLSTLLELEAEFSPHKLPRSFRIDPFTDDLDGEILRAKNIETIKCKFDEFVASASAELKDFRLDEDKFKRLQSRIPSDLSDAFDKNPAAVARFMSSWDYVNQAPFNGNSNLAEYLRGDRPNWALIGAKQYFKRDVEEDLFDALLDHATSNTKHPAALTLLGSAGYGTTTTLMAMGVSLVQEGVKPVFHLRPNGSVLEGDVEFITEQFNEAPFFLIDDGAERTSGVTNALTRLRQIKKPAFFLMGSRRNEWAGARPHLPAKVYDLEELSDDEIDRLLDYLDLHHALKKLEGLDRSLQQAEIRNRSGKQLLVTMREATEGTGFDAIIEDEFRCIPNHALQKAYLAVCCLNQYGPAVRDSVLASVMEVELSQLHNLIGTALDGVVHFDLIDEEHGIYAARSRHRVIAQIVWERCGEAGLKDLVIQSSLAALNLNFSSDVRAFELLVRADRLIDSISTLEGRIKYFEAACKKDPTSPYIRQHYARMLQRAGQLQLALGQINDGIELSKRAVPKVLYHTQGVVYQELMSAADSTEIARRRLLQAETSYNKVLSIRANNEYGFQGLASLFLSWAKQTDNEQEAADYVAKAEDKISEGLRLCKIKDGLWIISSEVQSFLGNEPRRLKALEQRCEIRPPARSRDIYSQRCIAGSESHVEQ